MKKITVLQKQLLKTAQEQYKNASEKLDIIIELIADAHQIAIPFRIDEQTDEIISQESQLPLDKKLENK